MGQFSLLDPPKGGGRRSHGIDLLRGAFSIYVLLFAHVMFWTRAAQGPESVPSWLMSVSRLLVWMFQSRAELNPAVLGFIVLSGFCIHRNGLRSRDELLPFAVRRAFRILPVFWLASLFGVLMFTASLSLSSEEATALTGTQEISGVCLLAKLSAVASIFPAFHPCDFLGNAPLLTVMVEIGLYAFYGFVFVKGGEKLVLASCLVSVLCGVIIAVFNLRFPTLYNWWQNSSLLAFLPYWWIGAAACVPEIRKLILRYLFHMAAVWFALTISTLFFDPSAISAELRKLVLATLMAWLMLKVDAVTIPDNLLSLIGRAGYSVYALHAPVVVYLCILGVPWWLIVIAAVSCGVVSFYLFERPLDMAGRSLAASIRRPQPRIQPIL
jgi:peptidoglycan/LPS O-acetylase OafA/YrhL